MSKVIRFPERKPDEITIEKACRTLCSGTGIAQRYTQGVQERAIKKVLAVFNRWRSPVVSLNFTPQVDFTEQQMTEVERVVNSATDKARSTYQSCVLSERLWRELEVENERHHPRAV